MRKLASWDAMTGPSSTSCRFNWIIHLLQILLLVFTIVIFVSLEADYPQSVTVAGWQWSTKSSLQRFLSWGSTRQRGQIPKWCWLKEVEIKSWILLKFHSSLRLCRSSFLSVANIFLFKWAPGLELKILMKKEWLWVSPFEVGKLKSFYPEKKQWTWNVISSFPWW